MEHSKNGRLVVDWNDLIDCAEGQIGGDCAEGQIGGDWAECQKGGECAECQKGGDCAECQKGGDCVECQKGDDCADGQIGGDCAEGQIGGDCADGQIGGDCADGQICGDYAEGQIGGDCAECQKGGDCADGQIGGDCAECQKGGDRAECQKGGDCADGQIGGECAERPRDGVHADGPTRGYRVLSQNEPSADELVPLLMNHRRRRRGQRRNRTDVVANHALRSVLEWSENESVVFVDYSLSRENRSVIAGMTLKTRLCVRHYWFLPDDDDDACGRPVISTPRRAIVDFVLRDVSVPVSAFVFVKTNFELDVSLTRFFGSPRSHIGATTCHDCSDDASFIFEASDKRCYYLCRVHGLDIYGRGERFAQALTFHDPCVVADIEFKPIRYATVFKCKVKRMTASKTVRARVVCKLLDSREEGDYNEPSDNQWNSALESHGSVCHSENRESHVCSNDSRNGAVASNGAENLEKVCCVLNTFGADIKH